MLITRLNDDDTFNQYTLFNRPNRKTFYLIAVVTGDLLIFPMPAPCSIKKLRAKRISSNKTSSALHITEQQMIHHVPPLSLIYKKANRVSVWLVACPRCIAYGLPFLIVSHQPQGDPKLSNPGLITAKGSSPNQDNLLTSSTFSFSLRPKLTSLCLC